MSEQSGIPAEFVYRQWAHESGNFSSQLARENNNFGGLTQTTPNGEENRQPDGGNYYKQYGSMHEYAEDYLNSFIKYYDGIATVKSIDEFAQVLRDNGYYTDSVENYARGLKGIDVEGAIDYSVLEPKFAGSFSISNKWDFEGLARNQGRGKPLIPQQENPDIYPASIAEQIWGGVSDDIQSNTLYGTFRNIWGNLAHSSSNLGQRFKVTEDDIKYVTTALAGDEEAQRFVLTQARDRDSMQWLLQRKIEERKRKEKLAAYGTEWEFMGKKIGWVHVGHFIGGLLDPINLIPVGASVNALRIMGRTAGTVTNVSKIAKYAQIGAQVSLLNTVDTGLRGAVHGYKPEARDYAWSASLGFLAGSILSAGGDAFRGLSKPRQRESMRIASAAHTAETEAVKYAADMPLTNEIRNETKNIAASYHDKEFAQGVKSDYLSRMEADQKVYTMSLSDAKVLARTAGKVVFEDAKAFHVPNENYTVLIKDNIKNLSKEEVEGVLRHELIGHAGMRNVMGEDAYDRLMTQVKEGMNEKGTVWNKARDYADSYDPEEVFAYALEHNLLKENMFQNLYGAIRNGLKRQGIDEQFSDYAISNLVKKVMKNDTERKTGVYLNDDGSTILAGVRFSRDNLLNPRLLADVYDLENDVMRIAQDGLMGSGSGTVNKLVGNVMSHIGKEAEASKNAFATPFGIMINSVSPTIRKYSAQLFDDARKAGRGEHAYLPAELQKEAIMNRLNVTYGQIIDLRAQWMKNNSLTGLREKHAREFDRMVDLVYNKKYAGHMNAPENVSPEVLKAVELQKKFDEEVESILRKSADMFGVTNRKNIIEDDWKPVDLETRRTTTPDLVNTFLRNFKDGVPEAAEWLEKYYYAYLKRDIVKAKIQRNIERENARLPEGSTPKSTEVTDEMIEDYAKTHIPAAVQAHLQTNMHLISHEGGVGELKFLKERVPIDTSGIMVMPNGKEFSFDNNLRSYDKDFIMGRVINRVAGEVAFSNVFKNKAHLDEFKAQARFELNKAADMGEIDRSRVDFELKKVEDSMKELRGLRTDRDNFGKVEVIGRILQQDSFARNGSLMGLNQLGELSGAIAYAGGKALLSGFKPLREFIENIKYGGEETASFYRDVALHNFGETLATKIWSTRYGDRIVRDALTKNSLTNKSLKAIADWEQVMTKATAWFNRVAHITDNTEKYVKSATICDSMRWAHGEEFSAWRNPFSEVKLKAANILESDVAKIKADIQKYLPMDAKGKPLKEESSRWMMENPDTYWKWYHLIQNQTDRALTSGRHLGNKNIFKDTNVVTRLAFQFKDYSLRSINAQGLRMMTSRECDDAVALTLSVAMNTALYAARHKMVIASMYALGASSDKIQEYSDKYLNTGQLVRAAVFRSLLGTPISPVNDFIEAGFQQPTIRTTVDSRNSNPVNSVQDFFGNLMTQSPGMQGLDDYHKAGMGLVALATGTATKRDLRNVLMQLPIFRFIPWVQFINLTVDQSKYPDKKPK